MSKKLGCAYFGYYNMVMDVVMFLQLLHYVRYEKVYIWDWYFSKIFESNFLRTYYLAILLVIKQFCSVVVITFA